MINIAAFLNRFKGKDIAVGIFVLLMILLRIWSIFEPHWNGEEGIYAATAYAMKNGFSLYHDIWADQAPGIYVINYIALAAGRYNLAFVKLLSLLFSVATLISTFHLVRSLLDKKSAYFATLVVVLLLGLPVFEANVAHPVIFAMPCVSTALYLFFRKSKESARELFIVGTLLAIGMLFSFMTFFTFISLLIAIAIGYHDKETPKRLTFYVVGFLCILIIPVAVMFLQGVLDDCLRHVLPNPIDTFFNGTEGVGFVVMPNSLFTRTCLLFFILFVLLLLQRRKYWSIKQTTIGLWGIFGIYGLFLYSYPALHLMLNSVILIALSVGWLIYKLAQSNLSRALESITLYLLAGYFILATFANGKQLDRHFDIYDYYINHYKYISRKIETPSYTSFFGENAYSMYTLNAFLTQNQKSKESLFIFTPNPWIYQIGKIVPLTQWFSSNDSDIEETKSKIGEKKPSLVIIDNNSETAICYELRNYLITNGYEFDRFFENYELYTFSSNVSQ